MRAICKLTAASHATGSSCKLKHQNYLTLLEKMMEDKLPSRPHETRSMADAFQSIRAYPLMGNFLAYQFVTDINYSMLTNFPEMEFVVAGPGVKDGIRKCFESTGGRSEADVIRYVAEHQDEELTRLGLFFAIYGDDYFS